MAGRHIKKGRDSVIAHLRRRFIICTPEKSGKVVSGIRVKLRGNQKNQKQKSYKYQSLLQLKFIFIFIGLLFGLFLKGELFLGVQTAKAASSVRENLNLAKTVVSSLSPASQNHSASDPTPTSFNIDGFLTKPLVTETVVTPEEKAPKKPVAVARKALSVAQINQTVQSGNRSFPYGYCTYYVAQKRFIPWSGNAISWLSGARSFGFSTGSTPQVGAIVVTSEGGRTGHVGMVDGVSGDQITITEMNYRGFGVISQRTISASYGRILGYIY